MAIFDCATWRPVQNHGGPMSRNLGLLLHHAVANGSLWAFFNTPSSQVSAHFWVSKSGLIEQYVDSEVVAWHAMQMNASYCGVETEGCTTPPYAEPMTDAMVEALGRLYHEGNIRHGWINDLANAEGELGLGFHRMGVPTGCPCDVRLNRRPDILVKAFGGPSPTPPPPVEEKDVFAPCTFTMNKDQQQSFYVDDLGKLIHSYQLPGKPWITETLSPGWAPGSQLTHDVAPSGPDQVWGMLANGRGCQVYWNGRQWVTQPLP